MPTFQLKKSVPGHENLTDEELDRIRPELSQRYHQIDLMTHCLRNRKFKKVYDRQDKTIEHLLRELRADSLPPFLHQDAKDACAEAIVIMRDDLLPLVESVEDAIQNGRTPAELIAAEESHPPDEREDIEHFRLQYLYEYKFIDNHSNSDIAEVCRQWARVYNLSPVFFCMPFVPIQTSSLEPVVSRADMRKHIDDIGGWSMHDMYTKKKSAFGSLANAVQHARDRDIFARSADGGMTPLGLEGPRAAGREGDNGKVCGENGCIDGDGFCNEDPDTGNCTTATP